MKNRKLKKSAVAVLAVIILAVVLAVVHFVRKDSTAPQQTETAAETVNTDNGQTAEAVITDNTEPQPAESAGTAASGGEMPVFSPLPVSEGADIGLDENTEFVLH